MGIHWNCANEAIQMSSHHICFDVKLRKKKSFRMLYLSVSKLLTNFLDVLIATDKVIVEVT